MITFVVVEVQKLREQETISDLIMLKKRALNDRLMLAERGFLDADGLKGKQWFKHLVSIFLSFCSLVKYNNESSLSRQLD